MKLNSTQKTTVTRIDETRDENKRIYIIYFDEMQMKLRWTFRWTMEEAVLKEKSLLARSYVRDVILLRDETIVNK